MTKKSMITQSELQRMAKVAKAEGVEVWMEIDGKRYGVSPAGPKPKMNKVRPEEFETLAEWQAWRDEKRVREAEPEALPKDFAF
ncbi:hypothetical protein OE766_03500 [Pararhizobium sp. YC-54]|uniref:hypothetical protein n=1 Tax=Pararhizobium sp. YC-54 TaxID=2986920 RepID=UPI0021F7B945|nr:hypothetical protein [Pararhizobium sp. YC-54]MCV9997303.1 hypothetical protein [Pararhizobium sp. YC-54]